MRARADAGIVDLVKCVAMPWVKRSTTGLFPNPKTLAVRSLAWVLLRVLPRRNHIVVHTSGDREENGLQVLRALSDRAHRIVWLRDERTPPGGYRGVKEVAKKSMSGMLYYATAKVVFFTHGLYGAPFPPRNRTFVNLWHGDGPKRASAPGELPIGATWAVTGARRFGAMRTASWKMPRTRLLHTGNPRSDRLFAGTSDDALKRLQIYRPFVLWLPTWREGGDSPAPPLAWSTHSAPPQFVVKPHPFSQQSRAWSYWTIVTDAALRQAHVTLYQLLGAADAILTDYSSVWTEYLLLDRPIGFWLPDVERYQDERGFAPRNWLNHLPGPIITSITPELMDPKFAKMREHARTHWQLPPPDGMSTLRLINELTARGVLP